jgi:hypothetical protein
LDQNQHFSYQGWTFRREVDGSLIVEPGITDSGSKVFGEPKDQQTGQMQPITIPQDEVYRLIGYCLTGDLNDTQVLQSLKSQYATGSKSLVGSGTNK